MEWTKQEIQDLIDYCNWKKQDSGTMSAFDAFDEMAERLGYLLNTLKQEEQIQIGWASESPMLDGM